MKRFFILFFSALCLLGVVFLIVKNGNRVIKPNNHLQQEKLISGLTPEKCELGYVESKSAHDFTLEITNASDENWQEAKIEIECDCITVLELPKIIPAQNRTPVKLRFTAPEVTGSYTKTITITVGEKIWQSRLHARIDAPIRVEPKDLIFSREENISEQPLTIFNEGTDPVRLLYATSTPAACNVKIKAEPIESGSKTTLIVTLNDPTPDRLISLNIQTNHRKQKKITIPIRIK
ncbi:MAG: DUF1573 domain-containing protein [Planctomycetaceae bacterium]|jgi:hypothetical protein|nr:DUF1573 domain-containing protein [Planctomycetaceae bacterium]